MVSQNEGESSQLELEGMPEVQAGKGKKKDIRKRPYYKRARTLPTRQDWEKGRVNRSVLKRMKRIKDQLQEGVPEADVNRETVEELAAEREAQASQDPQPELEGLESPEES